MSIMSFFVALWRHKESQKQTTKCCFETLRYAQGDILFSILCILSARCHSLTITPLQIWRGVYSINAEDSLSLFLRFSRGFRFCSFTL